MNANEDEKIFLEERRKQIIEFLSRKLRASVSELSQVFHIGEATIRRDLSDLEQRGLVQRTHGGVLIKENTALESPLRERETQNREAKERISDFIFHFVHNGETLMIDGGSTTLQIARMLHAKRGLVVVTNSPAVAEELVNGSDCQVIMTGGELREMTRTMIGPVAEHTVRQFRADRAVLGMSALLVDEGLFTVNHYEAEVKRAMMKSSKEVIVAMDSSKIGRMTYSFVCDFKAIDKLVTDSLIPAETLKNLQDLGVEVIVV